MSDSSSREVTDPKQRYEALYRRGYFDGNDRIRRDPTTLIIDIGGIYGTAYVTIRPDELHIYYEGLEKGKKERRKRLGIFGGL